MKNLLEKNLLAVYANLTGVGVLEWLANIDIELLFKLVGQGVLTVIAIIHLIKSQKKKSLNDK